MSGPSGGGRIYGQHGDRHEPFGSDPTIPGGWIFVGEDIRVPFVNGANAAPSAGSPDPSALAFRISLGRPNDCEWAGWEGSGPTGARPVASAIVEYRHHQLEIVGDVTDVNIGDVVFVLPLEYRFEEDRPCKGHDDAGNYVACRLLSTGEFIWGQP